MAIAFAYTEATNKVVLTGGTSGTPATFADFVTSDRTVATAACTVASGAELKAAAAVGNPTNLTLTYPMRPVENKALRLAITTAQAGGAAVSGDETVDIFGTTCIWHKMTGASAAGQKVVPIANGTHNYQVGDTVILIDISSPSTYETDTIASIAEGVSITMTNNNGNAYAIGDIVGIYQTEQIDVSAAFATYWSTVPYGQIAILTFTGFDGTNTAKVDQPIWGVIWDNRNNRFQIDATLTIGNGGTTTYFFTKQEQIYFSGGEVFNVTAAATFTAGAKISATEGKHGSVIQLDNLDDAGGAYPSLTWNGTINLYDTKIDGVNKTTEHRVCWPVLGGSGEFIQSCLTVFGITINTSNYSLVKVVFIFKKYGAGFAMSWTAAGVTVTDASLIYEDTGGKYLYWANLVANVLKMIRPIIGSVAGSPTFSTGGPEGRINLTDGTYGHVYTVAYLHAPTADCEVNELYTCNIEVADKDGTLIDDVTVVCEDKNNAEIFSELTGATDTGKIDEQEVTYKENRWSGAGSGNTQTTMSPHKFTLTKPGYETLVLDNVTVDAPVAWHLEMQPLRSRAYGRGHRHDVKQFI